MRVGSMRIESVRTKSIRSDCKDSKFDSNLISGNSEFQ